MSETELVQIVVKLFKDSGWDVAQWGLIVGGMSWCVRKAATCGKNLWTLVQPKLNEVYTKHIELVDQLKESSQRVDSRLELIEQKVGQIHQQVVK